MKWPHQFGFKKDGSPMVVPKPILDALKATKRFDGDGAGPILPYKKQVERLTDNGFVLWDVIRDCTITNSDDTSIKDEMPNKIFELLHLSSSLILSKIRTFASTAIPIVKIIPAIPGKVSVA